MGIVYEADKFIQRRTVAVLKVIRASCLFRESSPQSLQERGTDPGAASAPRYGPGIQEAGMSGRTAGR